MPPTRRCASTLQPLQPAVASTYSRTAATGIRAQFYGPSSRHRTRGCADTRGRVMCQRPLSLDNRAVPWPVRRGLRGTHPGAE
jgi:hypothetical protein